MATRLLSFYLGLSNTLLVSVYLKPIAKPVRRSSSFKSAHPVRVKILTYEFYVVQGPENIKSLFKNLWTCTLILFVKFVLGYAFGLPRRALNFYDKDDSGSGYVSYLGSTVSDQKRIDYRVYQSLFTFLEGTGLAPFYNRFAENMTQQLNLFHDRAEAEWIHHADLMQMVENTVTVSTLDALCGPHLLRLNPDFLHDFWVFDRNLQTYLQGIPWFLASVAYMARNRVLEAVQIWQQHATDNFDYSAIGPDGDDPFWSTSFFRETRHVPRNGRF
ncbi:hypothetical protein N0V90_000016 [Kalmusia sp. IMI 367209]|nr:hypothetical protein N0V90_000016 [Kalmusia sp. IMI 367209]